MSEETEGRTTRDLELSEAWDALVAAGATEYVVLGDRGMDSGGRAFKLGKDHLLYADDVDGFELVDADGFELVPVGDYDEDAAEEAAADLTGVVAVVGIPGSKHHRYRWFGDEAEADEWLREELAGVLGGNPALGAIESAILSARAAWDVKYQDGSRVYFNADGSRPTDEEAPAS